MKKVALLLLFVTAVFGVYGINSFHPKIAAAAAYTLTVAPSYDANDTAALSLSLVEITSTPAGIDCGEGKTACSASFAAGTTITLTGNVLDNKSDVHFQWYPGNAFYQTGEHNLDTSVPYLDCAGMDMFGNLNGNTCTAQMPSSNAPIHFAAKYTDSTIIVKKSGTGSGTVANQNPIKPPLIIDCGKICTADISSPLILFETPDPDSTFVHWVVDGQSPSDCTPTNYDTRCFSSQEVAPRDDGSTVTYVAVFNKKSDTVPKSTPSSSTTSSNNTPTTPHKSVASNTKTTTAKPVSKNDSILLLYGVGVAAIIVIAASLLIRLRPYSLDGIVRRVALTYIRIRRYF